MNEEQPITVVFPSGKVASKIVDLVVRSKPEGWSRKSYATYYSESYALWLKADLDKLIERRNPIVYRYDLWKMSRDALYLRINQAWRYLRDHLDLEDKRYDKLWHDTERERVRGVGITIRYKDLQDGHAAEEFVAPSDTPKWRKKLDEYLEDESGSGKPLHIDNLLLTPEDIEQLKLELDGLSNVIYQITSREIKVIRSV
jgi:hypothetical protein